ncbi:MAG TPA: extracellular solute-binding protein, partial [Microlunatus sp.]|nr:extracellular solute-binding protein [Microlunatus sp.]
PPELRDGKDFLDLCAQVTDAKRARFALGADVTSWILPAMLEMHEAPNGWALEGDTLVHAYETEQMKAALDQTARLLKLGYLHPDSPSAGNENYTWWQSGRTSMYLQSFAGWATYGRVNPDWRLGVIKLPKWEGDGPAPKHLSVAGYTAWVAIKKAEEDRVREVLRFADFVASPFGTSAELLINYGVEGTHFTLKGTDPVPTEQAKVDKPTGLDYFGGQASSVLYLPDARDLVQQQYDYLAEVLPTGVQNPTEGLHSETSSTTGSSATRPMADLQTQIILGRKPLSDWDEAVDRWRQEAGDQQRQEYLEQLQDQ